MSTFDSARAIVGPTGNSFSRGWEMLEKDDGAYLRSLRPEHHLPPSLFVSERDRIRHGLPVPMVERCLEDHGDEESMPVQEWRTDELGRARPAGEGRDLPG